MAYVYRSLVNPQNTSSGVAEYALLAPVSAFTADGIKCPEAPFTLPGDEVSVKQAHEFNSGEGFIKVQLAPEKNKLDAASIGDRGFTKLDMTLEIFIPGSYAEVHEAVKNWINKPLIVLIKDSECAANIYYQLGCDCASSWLSVNFSTGTTKDGVKGYTGTITYQNGYIQLYVGPAPTIKGSAPAPSAFDTTLGFTEGGSSSAEGVTPLVSEDPDYENATQKFKFTKLNNRIGFPQNMELNLGGNLIGVTTFQDDYLTKPFVYIHTDGVEYPGVYKSGTVNL